MDNIQRNVIPMDPMIGAPAIHTHTVIQIGTGVSVLRELQGGIKKTNLLVTANAEIKGML